MKLIMAIISVMSIASTVFASNLMIAKKIVNNEDIMDEATYKAGASEFKSIEVVSKGRNFEAKVKFTSVENTCSVFVKGQLIKKSAVIVNSISDGECVSDHY